MMTQEKPSIHRVRYESFGGIVSSLDPPFLAWVDRDFMQELGYKKSPLWKKEQDYLSAPTEVHFSVTNACSQGCQGCYMNSGDQGQELSTSQIKKCLKLLREMGVFHVALGGGEAFNRPDFKEIVAYCRQTELVPNLTTNGQNLDEKEIRICKMMGQVNVSVDGVGSLYKVNGRKGSFKKAHYALTALQSAGVSAGINCVVSSKNFYHLEGVVKYASEYKLKEIEFLRFKPSGRGKTNYDDFTLTQDMMRGFYPLLIDLAKKYCLELKIDCSFIPAMVWHKPPKEDLEKLAVMGCEAGNVLLGVRSNGLFSGCSFMENDEHIHDIETLWHTSDHLNRFRSLVARAQEPCRSCDYLSICRCGCRASAVYKTGDFFAPDPECPAVFDFHTREKA
jgi:radical SAM protein with 4Fe4S-binding SPASM domain